jgi:uncharacterized protein YjbI with pentapeptide repeats
VQRAAFSGSNLISADFYCSDLQGANLNLANMQGTNLWETNLQDVTLYQALFDEQTRFPDFSQWKPDTDMTRFTDPNHPQFWRSNDPKSPTYRGSSEGES